MNNAEKQELYEVVNKAFTDIIAWCIAYGIKTALITTVICYIVKFVFDL